MLPNLAAVRTSGFWLNTEIKFVVGFNAYVSAFGLGRLIAETYWIGMVAMRILSDAQDREAR